MGHRSASKYLRPILRRYSRGSYVVDVPEPNLTLADECISRFRGNNTFLFFLAIGNAMLVSESEASRVREVAAGGLTVFRGL
jgi:hypothetical protein